MLKVLLLTDKPNWAYHSIAIGLVKYNTSDVSLKIMHIKGNEHKIKRRYKRYDRVLVMGWQNFERVSFLDKSNTMVGIHSFHGWDKKKSMPMKEAKPPRKLIDFLSSFHSVNAISLRLYGLFKKRLNNIYYTPNGVDTEIFHPPTHDINRKFTVGYSGSKAHDWRKGVTKFILPSAKKAGVKTKIAMLSTDKYIPLEEMPKFYHQIDCYICASSSEGMSLSMLEAGSCGCPLISTRVSGTEELIIDGYNGLLADRTVDDIAMKISVLKKDPFYFSAMRKNVRNHIASKYSWAHTIKEWVTFFKS